MSGGGSVFARGAKSICRRRKRRERFRWCGSSLVPEYGSAARLYEGGAGPRELPSNLLPDGKKDQVTGLDSLAQVCEL